MSYAIFARRTWPGRVGGLAAAPRCPPCMVGAGTGDWANPSTSAAAPLPQATPCTGGERQAGSDVYCCPERLWTEATYHQVKGELSWRFWLEKFTQRALAAYFVPAGLEKVAYDMSAVPGAPAEVKVPVALRSRCALAIRNFNDSFQTDKRWVQNKSGVATDCTADGYYSTWGQSAAGMDKAVQAEAFKRMLGSGYSEANVAAFLTSALVVFGKVPRDFSPYPLAAMPPPEWGDGAWYNQPVKGMLNFFGWSANGDLAPLPPFSTAFLDLFAKGAATKVVAPVAFKMVPSGGQAAPAAPAAPAAHIVTAASARFVTPSAPRSRAVVYVAAAVGGAGLLLWLLLGLG